MKRALVSLLLAASSTALAQPPRVVKTTPANGAVKVPAGPTEIRIDFDQDMGLGMSLCEDTGEFARATDKPHWENKRTFVMRVVLEPGHHYEAGINCTAYKSFANAAGEPLVPVRYAFTTAGQIDAAKRLGELGVTPMPEPAKLGASRFAATTLDAIALRPDGIDKDFTNLDDLAWLKPIAARSKVVLFGEYHYYESIHHVAERAFFALNKFDDYALLTLELPYSVGAYFDHYVGLCDEAKAEQFFRDELDHRVAMRDEEELLRDIRRWNCTHPKRRLHVRSHDIEHDYGGTLALVLNPYFQQLGADHTIDTTKLEFEGLGDVVAKLERWQVEAKAKHLAGKYPFITKEYVDNVIANVRSLWLAERDNNKDFNVYRERAIIRNLTDRANLGAFFDGKVMIYAGAYHTATRRPDPDGANFLREGTYLSFEFAPTRGRTWSLVACGYAYTVADMTTADLTKHQVGTQYLKFVQQFRRAYSEKLVSRTDSLILAAESLDELDKLVLGRAHALGDGPLLVRRFDWDALATAAAAISPDVAKDLRNEHDEHSMYDASLFVPSSPIEVIRP